IGNILETSHKETIKKYIAIRNIGNSIIKKDGILQGIHYRETDKPELVLIFKDKNPLNWARRKKAADEKAKKALKEKEEVEQKIREEEEKKAKEEAAKKKAAGEETSKETNETSPDLIEENLAKISKKEEKIKSTLEEVEQLEREQKEYQDKYKDILEEIDSFDIAEVIKINNGEATSSKDDYDSRLPALTINEQILDYLLNSTNLGSDLDIALVTNYTEELKLFKNALESGILYPDFDTTDFTGTLSIQSKHQGLTILKQNNSMTIPSDFGKITVYLNFYTLWHNLKLVYTADNDEYNISSSLDNYRRVVNRGFVHKALLPEPYRKNK
ncbi:MAG: hypothetical protein K2L98_04415, partial [Bacilli bacterium]|nr:hypothetical protein [Bacilli bacterium]